jgi:hypothetical protein
VVGVRVFFRRYPRAGAGAKVNRNPAATVNGASG